MEYYSKAGFKKSGCLIVEDGFPGPEGGFLSPEVRDAGGGFIFRIFDLFWVLEGRLMSGVTSESKPQIKMQKEGRHSNWLLMNDYLTWKDRQEVEKQESYEVLLAF